MNYQCPTCPAGSYCGCKPCGSIKDILPTETRSRIVLPEQVAALELRLENQSVLIASLSASMAAAEKRLEIERKERVADFQYLNRKITALEQAASAQPSSRRSRPRRPTGKPSRPPVPVRKASPRKAGKRGASSKLRSNAGRRRSSVAKTKS